MATLHLKNNLELSQELLEEYCAYKWKQKLKKEVFLKASIFSSILFFSLFVLTSHPIILLAFFCSLLFIIYSVATFFNGKRRHLKVLKESKPMDMDFTFSDRGLSYISLNAESSFEWSYFKFYEINGSTFIFIIIPVIN